MTHALAPIGATPRLGVVPQQMYAQVIRPERFGNPLTAFAIEVIDVPKPKRDQVLVCVEAAGINYNGIWAALGRPVDVIAARRQKGSTESFHIAGSDASGIVYAVGSDVRRIRVGDEVVIHCGQWDLDCASIRSGRDETLSPSFAIWGYESNWGAFAQFALVQEHQCLPKPEHLNWAEAAAYMLTGATAYRMLLGRPDDAIEAGDVVLIWGGSGGLGSMAIQIARAMGAVPIAVVSTEERGRYCVSLGAAGYINRADFDHWGRMPDWRDSVEYGRWLEGVRRFGRAIWAAVGARRNPRVVFEHPGEDTIPTSMFVCEAGGTVVICAGTTGYNAALDLRHLWMRQKRLQGSHFANQSQCAALNQLVMGKRIAPCLGEVFSFHDLGLAHQRMHDGRLEPGNAVVLVGATTAAELGDRPTLAASR